MGNLKILVLAKQVTDTRQTLTNVFGESGVINRDALPAIFNPEDLNALEAALSLRERAGGEVIIISMGPQRAAEVIKEGMARGADRGVLLCDRRFAGADTLATSYTLAQAARKLQADVILCGRQSIDGDTGHVGAQTAQVLGVPQTTYAEQIGEYIDGRLTVVRRLDHGTETVTTSLPAVITVGGTAPECRPCNVRRMLSLRKTELETWTVDDLGGDALRYGMSGSPTKVISSVKIETQGRESVKIGASDEELEGLVKNLITNHLID